ncbi:MAG: hypothetical protein GVY04_13470 [Cyanobacteria bacterium]|nr:hypothetical protein [Cyanobacteria bacterium GSL.Bin1]
MNLDPPAIALFGSAIGLRPLPEAIATCLDDFSVTNAALTGNFEAQRKN